MTQQLFRGSSWNRSVWFAAAIASVAACSNTEDSGGPAGTGVDSGPWGSLPLPGVDGSITVISGYDAGTSAPVLSGDGSVATPTPGTGSSDIWCKAKAVIDANCVSCHSSPAVGGAPMPLTTWAETQGNGPTTKDKKISDLIKIRTHMTQAAMPPGGGLTAPDLAALDAWVDSGGGGGSDPTCPGSAPVPTVEEFVWPAQCTDQYRYKILAHGATLTTPMNVPAGQEIHPKVTFDAPWGSAAVQALAMKPITDNAKVLHHWILYATGGAFVTGWAPGKDKRMPLPDDVGMYLPSGAGAMFLDLHYYNTKGATAETDMSGVEICAVPKAMGRKNTATVTMSFGANTVVMAPANMKGYRNTHTCTVVASQPVHMLTASPHAHTLAVGMDFRATVGGKDIILHQADFDFNEQRMYSVPGNDIVLSTGDTVTTTCIYNNPTNINVGFGENTGNEMCFNFAMYYPMGALNCL